MSIEKPEKLDVLFHLGMDQKMTACLALLALLREARCSFISTSSPSAPNNLRVVCSECSTRSCGGHRRGLISRWWWIVSSKLSGAWRAQSPMAARATPPSCWQWRERRAEVWICEGHGAGRAGLGQRHKHQGWGTRGTRETLARTHSHQLVARSSSCSLCGWHWVKAKQSQWVVSTVHYKPGQQAG